MCRLNKSSRPKKGRFPSECQTSENNPPDSTHRQATSQSTLLSMHDTQTHKGKNSELSLKPCS